MNVVRCLLAAIALALPCGAAAQFWCWDADEVTVEVVGSTVEIEHLADLINCCPDPITWTILVGDATIFVEEHWESPCDCDCCYDLAMTIADVPPGPWILRYSWYDIESHAWVDRAFNIEVPDLGQGYWPYLESQADSDCLNSTATPEEPAEAGPSWGALKSLYR